MIQEQLSPQPELYEQVQFINTSDRPVCITGLDATSNHNSNNSIPIVLQQQEQTRPQIQQRMNQKKIILITSPNTTVLRTANSCANCNNCNRNPTRLSYQTITTQQVPRATKLQPQQQQQTRIISAPFLPRLPSTTPTVKQSSPIKIFTVKTAHPETHSSINHLKKSTSTSSSTPTTATISIDTVSLNPCKSYSQTRTQTVSKPTLAAMAGIQLTGSVESLPAAMSGAMQNATATVEEINVPVFIDEYLQQTTLPTTAATTTTNNSFNNDHTNNNNNSNPEGLFERKNGNGNTAIYIDEESNIFENFEFDFDLITADDDEESSTEAAANISEQQQQPAAAMYNMYGLSGSNNYNNNNNLSNSDNNYDDFLRSFLEDVDIKSESIKHEMEECQDEQQPTLQAQYQILPINTEDILSTTNDSMFEINPFDLTTEEAVDFTHANFEFSDCLVSSQNDPMLPNGCLSAANSQSFNIEIASAEPIVPELQDDVINAENTLLDVIKMEAINMIESSDECDGGNGMVMGGYKCSESGAIKRTAAAAALATTSTNTHSQTKMQEKRRKLRLDTSSVRFAASNNNNNADTLTTPGVIDLIDKMGSDKHYVINFNRNPEDIMTDLLSVSNSSFNESMPPHTPFTFNSSYGDHDDDENAQIDHEPPSTPQSCFSTSTYTNNTYTNTSPNSPALSTISNTTRAHSITAKSKRGRPRKTHSDRPDPSKLKNLSENERKRLEDRAKNNEASRLSRLKNKQREEQEIADLEELEALNEQLHSAYEQELKKEKKLKRALMKFHHRH